MTAPASNSALLASFPDVLERVPYPRKSWSEVGEIDAARAWMHALGCVEVEMRYRPEMDDYEIQGWLGPSMWERICA